MSSAATRDLSALARLFHALADEKRLRILELLRGGELCVCDLVTEVNASQPLLSFHLRILREAGLVSDRRDGRWVHYSLVPKAVGELRDAAAALALVTHAGVGVSCEGACCCG